MHTIIINKSKIFLSYIGRLRGAQQLSIRCIAYCRDKTNICICLRHVTTTQRGIFSDISDEGERSLSFYVRKKKKKLDDEQFYNFYWLQPTSHRVSYHFSSMKNDQDYMRFKL